MKINKLLESNKAKEDLEWNKYKITYVTGGGREDSLVFNTWQSDVEYAWRMSPHNVPHTKVKSIELLESKKHLTETFEVNQGDLVDFGPYGKLYVCNPNYSEDYYWVTDEKEERHNKNAFGWSISKGCAEKVLEIDESLSINEDMSRDDMLKAITTATSHRQLSSVYDKDKWDEYVYYCGANSIEELDTAQIKEFYDKIRDYLRKYESDMPFNLLDMFDLIDDKGNLKESSEESNDDDGWDKRWSFKDAYYKDDLVISKIESPTQGWHLEKVATNGQTIKHYGTFKSLDSAKAHADSLTEAYEGTYSDKFRNLIKKYEDEGTSPSGIINDIIRYCSEEDLKDLWFDRGYARDFDKDELTEDSRISNVEPKVRFKGKSAYTLTKDKKWEVDFDEEGNIVARTRHGNPYYFSGHINDKVNDFPSTDEDNIILAAREQHGIKFGKVDESIKESTGDTVKRWQIEYFIDENDDSDTPLTTYVYTDSKQEAINKVRTEYPNAQIVYCVSENVPAQYKKWDMGESLDGFVQTQCDSCGKTNKVKVNFPSHNKGFDTTTYKCKYCNTENELTDSHEYNDDGTQFNESTSQQDTWKLIKTDKWYDPEGLGIEPDTEVVCEGSYSDCANTYHNLYNKFKLKEKQVNNPQLTRLYIYTMRVYEKKKDECLVVEYPQAKSKDIYTLVKVPNKKTTTNESKSIKESSEESNDLKFVDNRKKSIISGNPWDDPGFDEYDIDESLPMNKFKVGDRVKQAHTSTYNVGTVTKTLTDNGTQYEVKWDYSDGPDVEILDPQDIAPYSEEDEKGGLYEDTAVSSGYDFDDDTDDLSYYYDDELFNDNLENSPYTEIASKSVPDFDGFMTDYTMYMNINTGEYVFILGDKDIYTPEDGDFDWECETEDEAREWFDSYNGYDDDIDESIMNESDAQESPIIHKKSDGSYLVAASNGDGYVAFNKSDVCMGNISANNETEAKNKFNANKFDE